MTGVQTCALPIYYLQTVNGECEDQCKGVYDVRRNALLKHFGSVDMISKADMEQLMEVPEMNQEAARNTVLFFQNRRKNGKVDAKL